MRYAIDIRAKKEVDAFDVLGAARSRSYSCPVCGAPVHYRSSMAKSSDPGFAHNKYAARKDCDLYHPGMAGYVPTPAIRPVRSAEDAPEEIGMCFEEDDSWRIYLRLPEISDLGDLRLSALQYGSVQVTWAGDRNTISLMDLRPGIGSARVLVSPSESTYKVGPCGTWPPELASRRWHGTARGLNPEGTLFVQRRGEWVRLKEKSAVELGCEIRVVALQSKRPPIPCKELLGGPARNGKWRVWKVELPLEPTEALEEWAFELGVSLVDALWEVSVETPPLAFSSGLPVFGTKESIVALLKSPRPSAQTMMTCRSVSETTSVSILASERSTAYVSVDVAWAGTNEFQAGFENRPGSLFLSDVRPELPEIRTALRSVPRLIVSVGTRVCECWTGRHELPAAEEVIQIEPEIEDLRLGLYWKGEKGGGAEEGLTRETAITRLAGFFGKGVDVRLTAGALGSVFLAFPSAREAFDNRTSAKPIRVARAAGVVGAWMIRQGAGSSRGRNRWTSLAISNLKKLRNPCKKGATT